MQSSGNFFFKNKNKGLDNNSVTAFFLLAQAKEILMHKYIHMTEEVHTNLIPPSFQNFF